MLLEFLYAHARDARFQCRIRWLPNTIVMWDNRCTQDMEIWDYFPGIRSRCRVTIKRMSPNN